MTVNELSGKVVVVTGATRGIGKASAVSFARAGAHLVIVGRSTDGSPNRGGLPGTLESVASELTGLGAQVLAIPADLSKQDDVRAVIERTNETYGGCDILVNNAAVSFLGRFTEVPTRRWRPVLEVNLLAPVTFIEAFLPRMLERGDGRILNVSSGAADTRAVKDVPQLPYAASKAGLDAMSFGLAHQLADSGVAVNVLAPEVLTESVTFSVRDPDLLETFRQRMAPVEPYGDAVTWVARQPASFTGKYLTNDDLIDLGALVLR